MEYSIISIIIPIFTILLAIISKDVIISLIGGIFAGMLVLHDYSFTLAFVGLFDGIIILFQEGWIVKTIIFMLFIGAIIEILYQSKAVDSFVSFLSQKVQKIDSPKGAMLLAYVIGMLIFIESSITSLIAGTVSKKLCQKNAVSPEKLAYICDSTSAPICVMIPLNAWGALILGLIVTAVDSHIISGDPVSLLISSLAYNFYAILTLILVLFVIIFDFNIGDMKKAKALVYKESKEDKIDENASLFPMLLPILLMVISVPIGLYLTGKGDIFKGSGSTAVYYSVIVTLLFIYVYFVFGKRITHKSYFESLYKGMSNMLPVVMILILALFIGTVIKDLHTAQYLSQLLNGNVSPMLIPMLIFLVSAITSFSTGTSWGTFSIMMPIALSLGGSMDLNISLVIASVLSGGIFGDHASPISDTTIISAISADCNHISHVRTQLPYALISGFLSALLFLMAGILL